MTASLKKTKEDILSIKTTCIHILANFAESFDSILHAVTEPGLIFVIVHQIKFLNRILPLQDLPRLLWLWRLWGRRGHFCPLRLWFLIISLSNPFAASEECQFCLFHGHFYLFFDIIHEQIVLV